MSTHCIGEPVSWLLLERYQLGELDAAERERVLGHLRACAACAACLARIEAEEGQVLPPLSVAPARPRAAALASPTRARHPARGRVVDWLGPRVTIGVGAVAVAAAVLFGVGSGWRGTGNVSLPQGGPKVPGTGVAGVKGDGIAFSLVRDDDERIADNVGTYHDGDRFKAVVTCPPGLHGTFDVVVFDVGGASFPLAPAKDFVCGNAVPLAGAFRLRGSGAETVCLVWGDDRGVDRSSAGRGEASLGDHASCKHLTARP